jgi:hypothetical protein
MEATPQAIIKIFDLGIKFLEKHDWMQKGFAATKHGRKVPIDSKEAKIFCASACIERALIESGVTNKHKLRQLLTIASDVFIAEYEVDMCVYNDRKEMTKEKVIQSFTNIKSKYERIAKQK